MSIHLSYFNLQDLKFNMRSIITKYILALLFLPFLYSFVEAPKPENANHTAVNTSTIKNTKSEEAPDINEFTSLIECKRYYLWSPKGQDTPAAHVWNVPENAYFLPLSETKQLRFNPILEVYNAYSLEECKNYYYIFLNLSTEFADAYVNHYGASYNCYGKEIEISVYAPSGEKIEVSNTTPTSTESSTNLSTGMSFNLGGVVGYKAGADIEMRSGLTISQTRSYTVEDVTVTNLKSADTKARWKYSLKGPEGNWFIGLINEGALVGRTTCNVYAAAILAFHDNGLPPHIRVSARITVESAYEGFFRIEKKSTDDNLEEIDIELPFISYGEARAAKDGVKL